MANLLATMTSIVIPLWVSEIFVPFLYHPYRWGGIPWSPPSHFNMMLITKILTFGLLTVTGTLSGMMSTIGKCRKSDWRKSLHRSLWFVLGYVLGNLMVIFIPFIKAPLLAGLMFLPYAKYIAHGLLVGIMTLIFGAIGNQILRDEVC